MINLRALPLCAALISVTLTGCSQVHTLLGSPGHHPATTVTGARLSALVPTPAGFTLNRSTSRDSGTQEATPIPGATDVTGISCASWWAGKAYIGPGTVSYTVRNYTGPRRVTLQILVNVYPPGKGAGVFALIVAFQHGCSHFSYQDQDGVRYVVNQKDGPSPGIGDQSQAVDATETAPSGAVFTTQYTFIEAGDALVTATETGAANVPVDRAALPLAKIVAALRAAG